MTTDDAPRPALDAATLERLRERYGEEEPPTCPVCGAAMENDDDAGNFIPQWQTWWRCAVDGERQTTIVLPGPDPDVLAVLDALPDLLAAAAERDKLARQIAIACDDAADDLAFIAGYVDTCFDQRPADEWPSWLDMDVVRRRAQAGLERLGDRKRAALASQEGATDGR